MDTPIKVLIIERPSLFRRGLRSSLDSSADFELAGVTDVFDEARRMVDHLAPHVALVGSCDSERSTVWIATELRRQFPAMATIIISNHEDDDELFAAIRAGASAYCDRSIAESLLHEYIRRAADGEYVINEQLLSKPYVASRVLDQFRNTHQQEPQMAAAFMPLTDRELEILRKVSDGLTNAEIGYALGISAQTVKNHVTSILRKLAVNDRTQAVVTALRRGWLTIDDGDDESSSDAPFTPPSSTR